MFGPTPLRKKIYRLLPRRRHLHGGCLHRFLGERLFSPELWKLTRRGLAGGLALGLFIGFTPTLGAQIILVVLAAYFLRVNVPVAIAASMVTNPLTAAVIYPLQFQLGVWIIGVPGAAALNGASPAMRGLVRYACLLWTGSLVVAVVAALFGYVIGATLWTETHRAREARKAHRRAQLASKAKLPPVTSRSRKLHDIPIEISRT